MARPNALRREAIARLDALRSDFYDKFSDASRLVAGAAEPEHMAPKVATLEAAAEALLAMSSALRALTTTGAPERAALVRVAHQLERAHRAAKAGAHGSDPALGAAMATGILKGIEPDLATLRGGVALRGARKHATREIVALAKEWYAGLVASAYAHFRPQLESGRYRLIDEDEPDFDRLFEQKQCGFESALLKRFIHDDATAHLIHLASEQRYCADSDPGLTASECLALDVFNFAAKSITTRKEGRAA